MQNIRWQVGCSGFSYREWKGRFYPEGLAPKNWFQYYAQQFSTVEINNTFYRFPGLKLFENWYQKAPPEFSFSVKVPRQITHLQKFKNTEALLHDFYRLAAEGLQEKLGAILFQLPPSLAYNENFLRQMTGQMDTGFRNVIEFRHESWWRAGVFEALKDSGIAFCGVSYPGLPNDALADLPVAYYRFHGVPQLYYSKYENAFLQRIVRQISQGEAREAFIYFNNTASGAALENAKNLQSFITAAANRKEKN